MHKWTMFVLVCAACVLGLSVLFVTIPEDKPHEEAAPVEDVPLDAAAAEAVYSKNCLICHGDQLQGGGGPALADVGTRMSAANIAGKIQKGGGGMPAFKDTLSPEEIGNLAKWLSEKK